MSLYIPESLPPIIPNAMARIERHLPYPGEILVRQGSRVEPEDTIAQTLKPEPPQIINIARALGIPPNQVYRAMRREIHNKVEAGQVLARSSGILGRNCLAPVSGMIANIDSETGYVTIAPDPTEYRLQATVRGLVMEIVPYESVVIETLAAQVYGAFGIGEERSGVLRLLTTDPSDIVRPEQIDARSAYAILICGAGIGAAALRRAVQEQVRGIIVGGIDEAELREFLGWKSIAGWQTGLHSWQWPDPTLAPDPKLTIVMTEGFGVRPMNPDIFDVLSSQDRQEGLIEGLTRLRRPLRRPRVVVPLTRSSGVQVETPRSNLQPGAKVRLLDYAHLGETAQVRSISPGPRRVGSRVNVPAVEVITNDGQAFWLPRTCVEVIA
ncbi:hypothetical protein [Candidatus Oscillochloris fontis]|uniref:hypothetical protein n=1 Tax=Candidatus Oscillochloris fontis TaxID=2496868 RepID=UPI00101BC2D1|nr:hypothetical protein [Candidatus Oscillochloris fontis]